MKRYLLFRLGKYDEVSPGGWYDWRGSFDTLKEAATAASEVFASEGSFEVSGVYIIDQEAAELPVEEGQVSGLVAKAWRVEGGYSWGGPEPE